MLFFTVVAIFSCVAFVTAGPLSSFRLPIGLATCPEVRVAKDFKLADLAGTWYEIERTPNLPETNMRCMTDIITAAANASTAVDQSSAFNEISRVTESTSFTITTPDPQRSGFLQFDGPSLDSSFYSEIVAFEAGKWSAAYNCTLVKVFGVPLFPVINIWVESTTRDLSVATIEKINKEIEDAGLSVYGLRVNNLTACD